MNKTENFNLLEEDWIPILWNDGKFSREGIKTTLTEAGRIRQIAASNPMDNVALLRLLLTVLQWCKPSLTDEERSKLVSSDDLGNDWLNKLERPKSRFDLLGDDRRFMQAPCACGQERPIADLFHELPGATNVAHLRHIRDYSAGACPACIAIGLARLPVAMTGKGRSKLPGINGDPPIYFIPVGTTLKETMLLNWPFARVAGDRPCWLNGSPARDSEAPVGVMEGFTWTSRQFRIDDRSLDTGFCVVCGESRTDLICRLYQLNQPNGRAGLSRSETWCDPHLAYTEDGKSVRAEDTEKNPTTSSGQWREWLKALIQSDKDGAKVPAVIIQAARRCGDNTLRINIVGMPTRQDKSVECWERTVSMPTQFLIGDSGDKCVERITNLSNAVAKTLDPQSKALAKPVGKLKDASVLKSLAAHERQKLHAVRSALADRLPALELTMFTRLKKYLASLNSEASTPVLTTEWQAVLDAAVLSTTPGSPLRRRAAVQQAHHALNQAMEKAARQSIAADKPKQAMAREARHDTD